MKSTSVICDGCGKDLTTTSNCIDYRLWLTTETLPPVGGSVTAMMMYPPIKRDYHFCGVGCLKTWANKEQTP